jgi:putative transposase
MGAEVPLQIADRQHQFGHRRRPGVQLDPQKLVRVNGMACKGQRRLFLAQFGQQGRHLAFQPLPQFKGHIEEVARSAGRVQHANVAKLGVEGAHGIAGLGPATFYKLKAMYGGMDLSDAKRLKQLEDENAKLKRLLADAMLDNVVLKDLLGKP